MGECNLSENISVIQMGDLGEAEHIYCWAMVK